MTDFGDSPYFSTRHGAAWLGNSRELLKTVADASVNAIITSPPYALHFKKEYGNVDQDEYVEWLLGFADDFRRVLTDDGSLVLNIGGSWQPGQPTRALCHFEVMLRLVKEFGFHLAQEFYWHNPAKLPAPAEWVNVRRIRVKDSVECLWWLTKTPWPKADNARVLVGYSKDMLRLIARGYKPKTRPSGHVITDKFAEDRGGAIPGNVLVMGNNDSNGEYLARCKDLGLKPHPARFPPQLPEFFIKFLTEPGDLVLDPFAGSNTTGAVAESLGRRWLAFEMNEDYLKTAALRFGSVNFTLEPDDLPVRTAPDVQQQLALVG
jgi:DNA modification methylase